MAVLVFIDSFVGTVINLYAFLIIVGALLSWVHVFSVNPIRNPIFLRIEGIVYQATEPYLSFLRRFIPNFGSLDITPLAGIFLLFFARYLIHQILVF